MYPVGTRVSTRTLSNEPAEGNGTAPVIVTVRDTRTGEVYLHVCEDYRDAHLYCQSAEDNGLDILHVLECEGDLSTGHCSGWVR